MLCNHSLSFLEESSSYGDDSVGRIWYCYPIWNKVSFTLVAKHHIKYLKNKFYVEEIDESAISVLSPVTRPLLIVHPLFYVFCRFAKHLERRLYRYRGVLGIDVADSDHISRLAVSITNYTDAVIVPSNFSRQAFIRSGVRVPVYVVPHGLEPEWFTLPPSKPNTFNDLWELKTRRGYKLLLFFLWHSEYRKGADLVIHYYKELRKERKDVLLVVKTMSQEGKLQPIIRKLGGIIVSGWLTETQKMELYDLADIYPLFTRGGGFEINGLEAIARGLVVLAGKGGAWDDYLPEFSLLPSKTCPYVLKDNPIHDGKGVEVLIDKAVDKTLHVLDNLDDYKARVKEHVEKFVKHRFTWAKVGEALSEIIVKYL